jgi:hypothetical protein
MKFKIGDKIIVKKDFNFDNEKFSVGDTGQVVNHSQSYELKKLVGVKWDKKIEMGHNACGKDPTCHSYYVPEEYLELVGSEPYKYLFITYE